jgi:acyl-CoA reductase-like NAD-dependent aldehyde dehydrogenase
VSQKQYDRVQSYIRKGIEEGPEVLVAEKVIRGGSKRVTSRSRQYS